MEANKRIIIVDDQQDLRDQLAKLLLRSGKKNETASLVQQMKARLLGTAKEEESDSSQGDGYIVTTAGQGQEAFELVKKAVEEGKPYAMMFLDMRMPPGWDGLETAKRVRETDKNIEIVIMTAYADHDQRTIAETVGTPEKLLYIKKPFQTEEIFQLALSLTSKWNFEETERSRKYWLETLIRCMSKIKGAKGNQNEVSVTALKAILSFTGASKGLICILDEVQNQWNVEHVQGIEKADGESFVKENSQRLTESKTTQNLAGKYLLPLKREGYAAVVVIYDVVSQNDPEWYKLLSLLSMTASEVLSSASHAKDNMAGLSGDDRAKINDIVTHAASLKEKLGNSPDAELASKIGALAKAILIK
ncbi:MAG: hypothetical protein A2X49_09385 [Lentisphaerae bacterium GWF2_52_8]|nr:MAG: hypothetical protein A2X49_09385 [Lentisphaerae bacterium GWF2_52_8]